MAAKNDVTGDSIKTKPSKSDAYAKGWERIFKKGGAKKKAVGKSKLKKNN